MPDALMSAVAMFSLKETVHACVFARRRKEEPENFHTVFGDSQVREILDPCDPVQGGR